MSDPQLVKPGDKIIIYIPEKLKATVKEAYKSKKEKYGTLWKYTVILETGEEKETRLVNIKWKFDDKDKKKRKQNDEEKVNETETKKSKIEEVVAKPSTQVLINNKYNKPLPFSLDQLNYILAPMVGASELPFRLLCRKYGATLAYTPMINSEKFAIDPKYREEELQTTPEDRPLVAHFSANNPEVFLKAAMQVGDKADAIDLNLGCPQRVAHSGHFGSYLLGEEDRPLVLEMIRTLSKNIKLPVFVKIRLLDDLEDTIRLCEQLVEAGASLIAIHGRHRVNLVGRSGPGARDGLAKLDQIKEIRKTITQIPIIANGNIRTFEDCVNNKDFTEADGVMSAEGILDNPALFNNGVPVNKLDLATEYLQLVKKYPTKLKSVVFHIRRMCKALLEKYQLMSDCLAATSNEQVENIVAKMKKYEKDPNTFKFDEMKAKEEKDALERKKREEGKRKEFEARMMRKAKREGKPLDFYLLKGAENPTQEILNKLKDDIKSNNKDSAFAFWKENYGQHCWSFHFDKEGCKRDRTCAFLHADPNAGEHLCYG